jgi:predicted dehydrogenase
LRAGKPVSARPALDAISTGAAPVIASPALDLHTSRKAQSMVRIELTGGMAEPGALTRRGFLSIAGATALSGTLGVGSGGEKAGAYSAAIIGHTGRGNYGHRLDRAWLDAPAARVVAVADPDPEGLAESVKRFEGAKGFTDYRRMLDEVKADFVSVTPRFIDQHRDMTVAAVEAGAKGIFLEKPMCRTLAEADEIVALCEKHNVKLAVAHQTRYSPKLPLIEEMIRSGQLGMVLEYRARGKEDERGGGEDLWVLGSHMVDLMRCLGGDAEWCFGTVLQEGRPVGSDDVVEGGEGIGPLAGDEVHATYRLSGGAMGQFDSVRKAKSKPTRFGMRIYGSEGVLDLINGAFMPDVQVLLDGSWCPGRSGKEWVPLSTAGLGKPEPMTDCLPHQSQIAGVHDLIAAVEEDRQPISSMYDGRAATEMIVSVFESQRLGRPVSLPLENRRNPFTML